MQDSHYTPTFLADYLISQIKNNNVRSVVDFCVGEGELLKAAQRRWKKAQLYGNDISNRVVQLLKRNYPEWIISNYDFFNINLNRGANIFKNKFDIILLNPPFTCKGSTKRKISFDNKIFNVSTAMSFFVESIKYLNCNGALYAILPQSIAYSQKDEEIRNYLYAKYDLKIINEIYNQVFEYCSPNIIIAALNDKSLTSNHKKFKQVITGIDQIVIFRGKISMYEINKYKKNNISLVHSTNLRKNKIVNIKYKVKKGISNISGPAILINRVGQPDKEKICIVPSNYEYALSDCIIGMKTKTIKDCIHLKNLIINNWSDFSNLYKGTGARYITIKRIKQFFNIKDIKDYNNSIKIY